MNALDRRLDDGAPKDHERSWLNRTANDLGLDSSDRTQLHRQYFDLLIQQMLADRIDTESEQQLTQQVAEAPALGPADIRVTEQTAQQVELGAGTRVCSTREATVDGSVADSTRRAKPTPTVPTRTDVGRIAALGDIDTYTK